jgi:hypothetical protein
MPNKGNPAKPRPAGLKNRNKLDGELEPPELHPVHRNHTRRASAA